MVGQKNVLGKYFNLSSKFEILNLNQKQIADRLEKINQKAQSKKKVSGWALYGSKLSKFSILLVKYSFNFPQEHSLPMFRFGVNVTKCETILAILQISDIFVNFSYNIPKITN